MMSLATAAAPHVGESRPHGEGATANGAANNTRRNPRTRLALDVSENGCFENDRVIKCGYVQRRTKTKSWKTVYLVLRPNAVSVYKDEQETKLRHQVLLSDLSAVAFLKDPKHKRKNIFGLFSPSKNFHFEAPTQQDAKEWVDLIRKDARLDEEEDEMFLGGPQGRRSLSPGGASAVTPGSWGNQLENMLSSSPDIPSAFNPAASNFIGSVSGRRRVSSTMDSSGLSGNEMYSYSDWSDNEAQQRIRGASFDNLGALSPVESGVVGSQPRQPALPGQRPRTAGRTASQVSTVNAEQESERVVWQGWIWQLRSKGGVKQWRYMWGVLRARKLVLYKDESEYMAQWIVEVSDVVEVVDIDPINKNKPNCLQIITEEKSFRFCAHDEESLVQFIGAFKSLLAKRRAAAAMAPS